MSKTPLLDTFIRDFGPLVAKPRDLQIYAISHEAGTAYAERRSVIARWDGEKYVVIDQKASENDE